MKKQSLLLHICCAPCSAYVVKLLSKAFDIVGYFYNPNIHPKDEYDNRVSQLNRLSDKFDLNFVLGEYDLNKWKQAVKGLEKEKEGGARCKICYQMRLQKTAEVAKKKGFEYFTTTLTISPHKKADIINSIGQKIAEDVGLNFLSEDFKKKEGFKISCQMADEMNIKRQNYCGCEYSQKKS